MNIVVCIKQTFDTETKITIKDDQIDDSGVGLIINPYDELALEEALRLKEKCGEGEVILVSMGGESVQKALRTGLAMGADRAILVDTSAHHDADEWVAAAIMAKAISGIPYDIILAGRVAVDDGSGQVAIRLAEILGIPSVNSILKLDITDGKAAVTREIDGGVEKIEVDLPVVLTAQKGLNQPRLPSMAGIMKAKQKELTIVTLADIGLSSDDLASKMKIVQFSLPKPRLARKNISGEAAEQAKELARLLREEAKVI